MINVLPTARDVWEARGRLQDWLAATPVLESEFLNQLARRRMLIKAECLQHGGSFKIRGALNRILQLSYEERSAGVVAFSSGNHAQAVALAGNWLGVRATIVMPSNAPRTKQAATRYWGAEVVLYDPERESREEIAAGLARERGVALVPPFDHRDVVAGQGTLGLELGQAAKERDIALDGVYVPCGGGGLIAGCALALKAQFAYCSIYAVEPEDCDDTARSLARGERQINDRRPRTLCDALTAPTPGAITFAVNRQVLAGAVTVTDAEVQRAMVLAARHLKLVVEPSGAVALAAALKRVDDGHERIGVVVSGGNVDPETLAEVLTRHADV
jgi:threonine dehydratase